jgi:hypothetical protein
MRASVSKRNKTRQRRRERARSTRFWSTSGSTVDRGLTGQVVIGAQHRNVGLPSGRLPNRPGRSNELDLFFAGGRARPVSDRKLGSANGNRTCIAAVQSISVRSKSLQTRLVCTDGTRAKALSIPVVVTRWSPGAKKSALVLLCYK